MTNDLGTPRALAELWGLLKDGTVPPAEALAAAFDMDRILGLGLAGLEKAAAVAVDPALAAWADGLVAERAAAKKTRDFARADAIRAELKTRGIILEDGPSGTVWKLQ